MRVHLFWRSVVPALLGGALAAGCAGTRQAALPSPPADADEKRLQAAYLESLLRAEPAHWRAHVRLAALHSEDGRDREAFDALRTAARRASRNVGVHAALAEAARSVGYLDWELYGWRQVIRMDPNDPLARVRLAQLYRSLGWHAEANGQLTMAARLSPDSLPVLREQAALHASLGARAETERLARRLTRLYPRSPYGYSLLADLAAGARRWREAVEYGRAALQHAPGDPSFLVRQAQYELNRTDAPDAQAALRSLEAALAGEPGSAGARYWRGVALRRLGRTQEAVRDLEAAYRAEPDLQGVALHLAELYRTSGREGDADSLLAEYSRREREFQRRQRAAARLSVYPMAPDAHAEMAEIHLADGDYGRALLEFLTARRLKQGDPAWNGRIDAALKGMERPAGSVAPLDV
jgi:tetratricopeptide (TPR) repeat protein